MKEGKPLSVAAGKQIFANGDIADCVYLIKQGLVRMSVGEGVQQRQLGLVGEGQLVGEMAVVDQQPHMFDAFAHTAVELQRIDSHQLLDRIEQLDPIVKQLLENAIDRYRSGLDSVAVAGVAEALPKVSPNEYYALQIEAAFKEDMAAGLVMVEMQPILTLHSKQTVGYEALLRWAPAAFPELSVQALVNIAEQTCLINQLGDYIFERACTDFVGAGLHQQHWLSINISAKQLLQPDFVDRCYAMAERVGMPFTQLVFELTESCIPDSELIRQPLQLIRDKGARVALDDYGNGSSSLIHVCNFQVDFVKLDREIISGIEDVPEAKVVTKAVIGAAEALDIGVVAEGVETASQQAFLESAGCHYVQGYLFARPAPAASFH